MRIRTIGVIDRREDVRFACTACDTETVRSYKLGDYSGIVTLNGDFARATRSRQSCPGSALIALIRGL